MFMSYVPIAKQKRTSTWDTPGPVPGTPGLVPGARGFGLPAKLPGEGWSGLPAGSGRNAGRPDCRPGCWPNSLPAGLPANLPAGPVDPLCAWPKKFLPGTQSGNFRQEDPREAS